MSTGSSEDVDPIREVRRLHLMIGDWFAGVRNDLDPLEGAMARDFTAVTSDGEIHDASGYLEALAAERDTLDRPRIEVEEISEQRSMYDLYQISFEKIITTADREECRTCSVWVRETNRTATGLQLLHLHETTQPPAEEETEDD